MAHSKPIEDVIEEKALIDAGYAIAFAILRLADAQRSTAGQIRNLGLADAGGTSMGAIELLASELKGVRDAIHALAEAHSE